jgi:Mg/Co/Ni transporter MgtE
LIREAEALWHVDRRILHRLAAMELGQLLEEVPPRMRRRVNQWLKRFHTATRLP